MDVGFHRSMYRLASFCLTEFEAMFLWEPGCPNWEIHKSSTPLLHCAGILRGPSERTPLAWLSTGDDEHCVEQVQGSVEASGPRVMRTPRIRTPIEGFVASRSGIRGFSRFGRDDWKVDSPGTFEPRCNLPVAAIIKLESMVAAVVVVVVVVVVVAAAVAVVATTAVAAAAGAAARGAGAGTVAVQVVLVITSWQIQAGPCRSWGAP